MLSKNHPVILFIDRFGFSVYQDTLTNIPKFSFTPDLVANLDVINKEQFVTLIGTFIQINKMVPSSLAVVLSDNVIYIKDLANPAPKPAPVSSSKADEDDDKEHEDEVQSFLEDVPFEEVLAKVIKVGAMNRVVAVNKDLVMAIIDAFISKGFTKEAVVPGFMYGQNVNFTAGLTADNVRVILEDTLTLKSGNLLTDQEKMIPSQGLESELKGMPAGETKKPQSLRQYILIGIFITLLIILAVVYLNLGASQTPPKSPKVKNTSVVEAITPTVSPLIQPTSVQTLVTSTPVDLKSIKIKIAQSSQAGAKVASLKAGLLSLGLRDIVDEISEASIPEKSSVIFSPNIPADLRNNIIVEIRKVLPDVSTLENQDVGFTINISIGKS